MCISICFAPSVHHHDTCTSTRVYLLQDVPLVDFQDRFEEVCIRMLI